MTQDNTDMRVRDAYIYTVSEGLKHDGSEVVAAFYDEVNARLYAKALDKKDPYYTEITPVKMLDSKESQPNSELVAEWEAFQRWKQDNEIEARLMKNITDDEALKAEVKNG